MLQKLTKMVPKWSQNLSKIDPRGPLEASWEPPLKQGASKTSFLMILAPFFGPVLGPFWDHFGYTFFDAFLKCLFEGFGLHLGSQNTSKMRPKRGSKSKHENRRCCYLLYTLATFRGAENAHVSVLFWSPLLGWLLDTILEIWAHFWGPFWRPFWSLFGLSLIHI